LAEIGADHSVEVTILRRGEEKRREITLGRRPSDQ